MKWLKYLLILAFVSSTLVFCGKDKDLGNCDGLVNDPPEPGDPRFFVQVPNAFTPNGDGRNDKFGPFFVKIRSVKFTVYNRNNDVVFYTEDPTAYWDPAASITTNTKYYYRVEAVAQNGRRVGKCGEVMALLCDPTKLGEAAPWNFPNELDSLGMWTNVSGELITRCR